MPQHANEKTASAPSPPRSVTDVLCREVGARHPDGALKQIRTMKRLLRSHYRVQQRLEEYGVESLEDAVSHIAGLTRKLDAARKQQRRRARRRLTVIETLLEKVELLRRSASADAPPAGTAEASLSDALDLVEALTTELNELRLELWLHQSGEDDRDAPDSAATQAPALLDRLTDTLRTARTVVDRLQDDRAALRAENKRLQQEVDRLRRTVQEQQSRLDRLDDTAPSTRAPSPSS